MVGLQDLEKFQYSYVKTPEPLLYGNDVINKIYVGVGKVNRDVSMRNAENSFHYRLLKLEDQLYEIDQEIFQLEFLVKKIKEKGTEGVKKKIGYFNNLKLYLETCKDDKEFLNYLEERLTILNNNRNDVKLNLITSSRTLLKKTYDQKTQNELYYDSQDFHINSLDCLYDYLQKSTFEFMKTSDFIYDINSLNHLRLRDDKSKVKEKNGGEGIGNANEKDMIKSVKMMNKSLKKDLTEDKKNQFDLSVNNEISEKEIIIKSMKNPKIVIKTNRSVFKSKFDNLRKINLTELGDLKKIISMDFSSKYIVKLMIKLLIRRSVMFYDHNVRVV